MEHNPVKSVATIAALAREAKIDAARAAVLEMVRDAPELAAQWSIFARIMVSASVEQEIGALLQEYGSAAAKAYQKALSAVEQALAPAAPPADAEIEEAEEPPEEAAEDLPPPEEAAPDHAAALARLEGFRRQLEAARAPDPLEGLQRFLELLTQAAPPAPEAGEVSEPPTGVSPLPALEAFLARIGAASSENRQARALTGLEGFLQNLTAQQGEENAQASIQRALAGLEGFLQGLTARREEENGQVGAPERALAGLEGFLQALTARREEEGGKAEAGAGAPERALAGLEGFLGALTSMREARQQEAQTLSNLETLLERLRGSSDASGQAKAVTALEDFLHRLESLQAPTPGPTQQILRNLEDLLCKIGRFSETIAARS